jgi:polyisoprenoid-binding protein YceI
MLDSKQSNRVKAWRLPLALAALLVAGSSWAQWQLDSGSSAVNFVSIKNDSVAENHRFGSLSGDISADGAVTLTIVLDSVDTGIEIRDQRMREVLFETVKFPAATVSARVDPAILKSAPAGDTVSVDLPIKLALHGIEKELVIPVLVVGDAGGSLQVFTPRPVLLNAGDFGLAAGIAALQQIAGLQAISTAVPVSVHLVFSPVP